METTLYRVIADIREKSGLGAKPMLSDLPDEIGKMRDEIDRLRLRERKIIDMTWGQALMDGSVPSTKIQDRIIAFVDNDEQSVTRDWTMRPSAEFAAAVRARVLVLTGQDMGDQFVIRDIFPGTDPNTTEADMIEAMAQSLARIHRGEAVDRPPVTGKPPRKISDILAELGSDKAKDS